MAVMPSDGIGQVIESMLSVLSVMPHSEPRGPRGHAGPAPIHSLRFFSSLCLEKVSGVQDARCDIDAIKDNGKKGNGGMLDQVFPLMITSLARRRKRAGPAQKPTQSLTNTVIG